MNRLVVSQIIRVGLSWLLVWAAFWTAIGLAVAWLDPDSMDPGDVTGMVMILGSMGILTGIVFGVLTSQRSSLAKVIACGILATAIVQVPYLGHGDAGLVANLSMALLFSGLGGVVSAVWWAISRIAWSNRHLQSAG